MSEYYPPVGFYFTVSFTGINPVSPPSFKEVSGLTMEIEEDVKEGGENKYVHRLPTSPKYSNLVLKRGLLPLDSELLKWVKETLDIALTKPIQPKNISVNLLDAKGNSISTWNFVNAWPVKWEVSQLDSMKNEVVAETLEFAYSSFSRSQ